MILVINILFTFKPYGQIQNHQDSWRWCFRYCLQGNQYQNQLNRRHQENEAKIHKLELVYLTSVDKVVTEAESWKRNQTEVGIISG